MSGYPQDPNQGAGGPPPAPGYVPPAYVPPPSPGYSPPQPAPSYSPPQAPSSAPAPPANFEPPTPAPSYSPPQPPGNHEAPAPGYSPPGPPPGFAPQQPYGQQPPGPPGYVSQQPPYGQQQPPQWQGAPGGAATGTGLDPKLAATLTYALTWVTGLIFIVVEKGDRRIRFHAWQSLAVFGALGVASIVVGILANTAGIGMLFGLLHTVITLGGFVLWVFLLWKTWNGEDVRLPVAGEFAAKQSGY